ncbi:hypothetical protein Ahy_A06g030959 [Arachis hypogaea]|uniref:AAA+ ATPase At3g28540-like C-terminal domain-containing protein n=1 Tax=Arachis hypogaea TaxID=3818 RepID=A0A445CXZ9_ARAHY|nr:hypothetical protein Ahy_A06g030959 [Arachis hypogaea]
MDKVNATPAEVAGELMKSDNVDIALKGLINFLQSKHNTSNDYLRKVNMLLIKQNNGYSMTSLA